VRRWTNRLLADDRRMNRDRRAKLVDLAASEPEATVRSQLASSCQRWAADEALPILGRLVRRDADSHDPLIPNLVWWAFERHLRREREAVVELLSRPEIARAALVRDAVLERVARALASEGSDGDFAACARLLAAAPGAAQVARLIAGLEKGLEGRTREHIPAPLAEPLARLWAASQPAPGVALIRLSARMGSRPALAAAAKQAGDAHARESDRIALIELLGQLGRTQDGPVLIAILRRDPSPPIQLAAIAALGSFGQPALAPPLLEHARSAPPAIRDRILGILCTRPDWTAALLDAIARRQISAKDLTPAHVQRVAQLSDPALLDRLESLWGKVPRVGSPEKKRRIAEIRGLLPEGDKGQVARGRPIFKEHCAVCHKLFDEGESIGPDLTGAERGDLDFLMTSLVDPSALVRKEYQAQTLALRDGRVLTALIVDEDDRTVTLVDSNRQKTVIPRDSVEDVKPSDVSLMPEGLLDRLSEPQIRDLFRYLQGQRSP
jgi:putative heme-binding domain-containing protein